MYNLILYYYNYYQILVVKRLKDVIDNDYLNDNE